MSLPPDPPSPPPGWYPDPWETAPLRWWNGQDWTGRIRGTFDTPAVTTVPASIPPSQFWTDTKAAARACFGGSRLLIATLAIEVIPPALNAAAGADSLGALALLAVLVELGTIGFYGTQRVWLLRISRGDDLSVSEVYSLTKGYFGRFFGLGVRVFLPFGLVVALVAVTTRNNVATLVAAALVGYVLDILLTFVVPDLTFGAASAKHAWESGRALLRQSWPQSRWYVLAPGIALLAVTNALGGSSHSIWIVIPESVVSAVLSLIFRGAILAYYVRLRPDTPDYRPHPRYP